MTLLWMVFSLLSFLTCIEKVTCQSSNISYETENSSRLNYLLLSNYDSRSSDTKPVHMHFTVKPIKIVNVDFEHGLVTLDLWLTHSWIDRRLAWDPEEFGITKIDMNPNYIYVPQVDLYYGSTTNLFSNEKLVIYYSGAIYYVKPIRAEIFCGLPNIPFHNTICNMTFGSWVHDDSEMNLTTTNEDDVYPVVNEIGMCKVRNARARIDRKSYPCCAESYSSVMVFLKIGCYRSRATAAQALRYRDLEHVSVDEIELTKTSSLPVVLAPFLVLLIFLLPPRATDRVFLGAIVFLYLLLIWTSGVLTAEYQSFHKLSIWVTVTATFASLVSCRMSSSAGVSSNYGTNNGSEPKESWCKRRLASMIDIMMFAALAVVLGVATAGLLA